MDLLDYLFDCGGNERFDFKTHEEARHFGHTLRENMEEEGIPPGAVEVDIGVTVVRVKVNKEALVEAQKGNYYAITRYAHATLFL